MKYLLDKEEVITAVTAYLKEKLPDFNKKGFVKFTIPNNLRVEVELFDKDPRLDKSKKPKSPWGWVDG